MKDMSIDELKKRFKKMYREEFNDPNESFMDYLLDLISKENLEKVLLKGDGKYYSLFNKYK